MNQTTKLALGSALMFGGFIAVHVINSKMMDRELARLKAAQLRLWQAQENRK